MSEEVQAVESVEPSVEDSSPSTAQSDNSFDFATDLSMDNDTQVESNGAGTTTNFDASSVTNWAAEDKSKVPEQYHGVIDQAKKQQADYTRKTQDLADQRRQFEQQMLQQNQMIQTLQQQINQPQNQQNNDPYADLRERLGPDESSAIDVVRQIIKTESQGYEDKLSKIDQLEKGVTALLQQQNVGRLQNAASQLQEARDKYGGELDKYADGIKGLISANNPETNAKYTITEAYELLSGEKANQAASLRQTNQNVRRASKKRASSGSSVTVANEGAPLSDSELVAELRNLGFE
tara:strand:+ start:1490 stop:2368 length:879 start_codon:yes stop_codon:yes gene_type:complete